MVILRGYQMLMLEFYRLGADGGLSDIAGQSLRSWWKERMRFNGNGLTVHIASEYPAADTAANIRLLFSCELGSGAILWPVSSVPRVSCVADDDSFQQ